MPKVCPFCEGFPCAVFGSIAPKLNQSLGTLLISKPFVVCVRFTIYVTRHHDRIVLAIHTGALAAKPIGHAAASGGGAGLNRGRPKILLIHHLCNPLCPNREILARIGRQFARTISRGARLRRT
jgi:hypothetical protein